MTLINNIKGILKTKKIVSGFTAQGKNWKKNWGENR